MPFPLAHPAAVLPLRRWCPRLLSFPALVIGSLSPDLGYAFMSPKFGHSLAHPNSDAYTHQFWPGSLMFCLPAGLVVLVVFHLLRRRVVKLLPVRQRELLLPLCQGRIGSPVGIVVSVLLGVWLHLFLDALTHGDGWLVEHWPGLQRSVLTVGYHRFQVAEVLYAVITFAGVAWLAAAYWRWLGGVAGQSLRLPRGGQWGSAILLASAALYLAQASRGPRPSLGLLTAGILTVLLVIGFLAGTGMALKKTGA